MINLRNCFFLFSALTCVLIINLQACQWIEEDESKTRILSGKILYNGEKIHLLTEKKLITSIYDKETEEYYRDASISYDNSDGSFRIENLPKSKIGVYFIFHDVGFSNNLPGNYQGHEVIDMRTLPQHKKMDCSVSLEKFFHLVKPFDNTVIQQILPSKDDEYPIHKPPVTFQWEPIEGARRYRIFVSEYRTRAHPDGPGFVRQVM